MARISGGGELLPDPWQLITLYYGVLFGRRGKCKGTSARVGLPQESPGSYSRYDGGPRIEELVGLQERVGNGVSCPRYSISVFSPTLLGGHTGPSFDIAQVSTRAFAVAE